jgi:glycosyltransferase involved in cell wall biosynthesis
MKVSICIPTWEQYGYGVFFLKELLETIKNQSYQDLEVIISDHSDDYEIKNLSKSYSGLLDVKYFKNNNLKGNSPHNTNQSIKYATGEIIKIMFQDDFFVDGDAIKIINEKFMNNKTMWAVNGCNHTNDGLNFYGEMTPKWNDRLIFGVNTISSPSVLSFRNENVSFFDENLTMLMDCEYYYQLYLKYGEPIILNETLISNRIHQFQISTNYEGNINEEINYIKKKYKW